MGMSKLPQYNNATIAKNGAASPLDSSGYSTKLRSLHVPESPFAFNMVLMST